MDTDASKGVNSEPYTRATGTEADAARLLARHLEQLVHCGRDDFNREEFVMVGRLFASSSRRGATCAFATSVVAAVAVIFATSEVNPEAADAAPSRALFCAPYAYVPVVLDNQLAKARGETG